MFREKQWIEKICMQCILDIYEYINFLCAVYRHIASRIELNIENETNRYSMNQLISIGIMHSNESQYYSIKTCEFIY